MKKQVKLCARCADNLRDIRRLVLHRAGWERDVCPVCRRKAILDEYTSMRGGKRSGATQKSPL